MKEKKLTTLEKMKSLLKMSTWRKFSHDFQMMFGKKVVRKSKKQEKGKVMSAEARFADAIK